MKNEDGFKNRIIELIGFLHGIDLLKESVYIHNFIVELQMYLERENSK